MSDKRIKLFVDAHSFDIGFHGTQTFIRELYACLLDKPGLDIYWGVQNISRLKEAFPKIKPGNILPYKKRAASILRLVFDIPAYIKQYRFDFAHFQYISPLPQAGCQYIVTTHDVLFKDYKSQFSFLFCLSRNLLFRLSIQNAAIKTTVSAYSRQRISHHYNIPEKEIRLIANGITKPQISKAQAGQIIAEKFGIQNFILYVSRVEPRKNHLALLKKYLKLQLYDQGIALVFIGQQSEMVKGFQRAITTLTPKQQPMVHWFPQVEQRDMDAFYLACRLFVYPSKAEGFGIPPLEAAVSEVPVLCSCATAMADYGFFKPYTFDPDDEQELELKLSQMINEPPPLAHLKQAAETVLEKYQWQRSAEVLYNLLVINYITKPVKQWIKNNNQPAFEAYL